MPRLASYRETAKPFRLDGALAVFNAAASYFSNPAISIGLLQQILIILSIILAAIGIFLRTIPEYPKSRYRFPIVQQHNDGRTGYNYACTNLQKEIGQFFLSILPDLDAAGKWKAIRGLCATPQKRGPNATIAQSKVSH